MKLRLRPLGPLIRWPGGQTRDALRFVKMMPKHSTYVEPFAGGLSVFFAKRPVETEVVADTDPWLIDFYKQVQKGKLRQCRGGVKVSRSLFERSKKRKAACYKFALSSISYDGNRVNYGPSGHEKQINGRQKLKKLPIYEARLRHAIVKRSSFEKTMKQHDGVNTVHFLDPPWNIDYAERMYHGGERRQKSKLHNAKSSAFDPHHVARVAAKMKGHVIVVYKDNRGVREAFRGRPWRCRIMRSTRGANVHGARPINKLVCMKPARRRRR